MTNNYGDMQDLYIETLDNILLFNIQFGFGSVRSGF